MDAVHRTVDDVRTDIMFALTKQPGQPCTALDGDAYSVFPLSFYEGKVPPSWLGEINKLVRQHTVDYTGEYTGRLSPKKVWGVDSLSFHAWAAGQAQKADPAFWPGAEYLGRGRNALAIYHSLYAWAEKGEREEV